MNEETMLQLGEKAEQALQILGEKLGQGAEYVWPLLIKQQYVIGIKTLIFTIALFGLCLAGFYLSRWGGKQDEENKDDWIYDGEWKVFIFFSYCLMTATFLSGIGCIVYSIGLFVNPEYYALQEVFNLIK